MVGTEWAMSVLEQKGKSRVVEVKVESRVQTIRIEVQ
jgi:hypothetical protein